MTIVERAQPAGLGQAEAGDAAGSRAAMTGANMATTTSEVA
jgi:hypothetical protein